jgi:hypothetical protein
VHGLRGLAAYGDFADQDLHVGLARQLRWTPPTCRSRPASMSSACRTPALAWRQGCGATKVRCAE